MIRWIILAPHMQGKPRPRGAKSVTTVPAVALAQAGQLTYIVRVIGRYLFFSLPRQSLKYLLVIDKSSGNETRYWKSINNYS